MVDDASIQMTDSALATSSSTDTIVPHPEGARGNTPPSSTPIPTPTIRNVIDDSLSQYTPTHRIHNVIADSEHQWKDSPADVSLVGPTSTGPDLPGSTASPATRTSRGAARAKRNAKHHSFMEYQDQRLNSDVRRIMRAAFRAPEVAASGPPADMSPTEVRIARDAMSGPREAPMYLGMAQRILESYKRADVLSERDPAPRLNVETIQVAVTNTYNYEVMEAPEQTRLK